MKYKQNIHYKHKRYSVVNRGKRIRLWVASALAFGNMGLFANYALPTLIDIVHIEPAQAIEIQEPVAEPTIEEYIFNEVKNALGLHEAIKAVAIVQCESGFRDDIVIIEPNDTTSLGAWQINTVHNNPKSKHYISNADKLDYKKATAWAIEKRTSDGNWTAWTCSKKLN